MADDLTFHAWVVIRSPYFEDRRCDGLPDYISVFSSIEHSAGWLATARQHPLLALILCETVEQANFFRGEAEFEDAFRELIDRAEIIADNLHAWASTKTGTPCLIHGTDRERNVRICNTAAQEAFMLCTAEERADAAELYTRALCLWAKVPESQLSDFAGNAAMLCELRKKHGGNGDFGRELDERMDYFRRAVSVHVAGVAAEGKHGEYQTGDQLAAKQHLTIKDIHARLILEKFSNVPASRQALYNTLKRHGIKPVKKGEKGRGKSDLYDYDTVKNALSR